MPDPNQNEIPVPPHDSEEHNPSKTSTVNGTSADDSSSLLTHDDRDVMRNETIDDGSPTQLDGDSINASGIPIETVKIDRIISSMEASWREVRVHNSMRQETKKNLVRESISGGVPGAVLVSLPFIMDAVTGDRLPAWARVLFWLLFTVGLVCLYMTLNAGLTNQSRMEWDEKAERDALNGLESEKEELEGLLRNATPGLVRHAFQVLYGEEVIARHAPIPMDETLTDIFIRNGVDKALVQNAKSVGGPLDWTRNEAMDEVSVEGEIKSVLTGIKPSKTNGDGAKKPEA